MKKASYWVKKDPDCKKEDIEWVQMDGKTFYGFLNSEAAKGRWFIHLTDADDGSELFLETTYEEYQDWKQEHDAAYYRSLANDSFRPLSLDAPMSGGDTLYDLVAADSPDVEDLALTDALRKRLTAIVRTMPEEDRRLLHLLYLDGHARTEAEAAALLGISQTTVHRKKVKALLLLSSLFD